jgi:hypothetical protein
VALSRTWLACGSVKVKPSQRDHSEETEKGNSPEQPSAPWDDGQPWTGAELHGGMEVHDGRGGGFTFRPCGWSAIDSVGYDKS